MDFLIDKRELRSNISFLHILCQLFNGTGFDYGSPNIKIDFLYLYDDET